METLTNYHVVRYHGPFGYIKPWTAVRDGETFSQQFLTPSTIEGMREKLGVSAILRHRLSYQGMDRQQERIQAAAWEYKKKAKTMIRQLSILKRHVLLEPVLHLVFPTVEDAHLAASQHLCLCRNEDVVLPGETMAMTAEAFNSIPGFELLFGQDQPGAFLVGYNRFEEGQPMYGRIHIVGHPTAIPVFE